MKLHCASHSLVDFHAGWCSRTCFVRRPGSSAATAAQFKEPAGAPPAAAATARRTTSSSPGVQGPFTRPSFRTFSHRSAHWEGLRAPRRPAPPARPSPARRARRVGLDDGAERLVLALGPAARLRRGTAKPPRGGVTTPAAGATRTPRGRRRGAAREVPRRAERGDPRALRRRVVYDQRGGLEPAGADFMTLKRGSPNTAAQYRREANLRGCNAMKIRLRRPPDRRGCEGSLEDQRAARDVGAYHSKREGRQLHCHHGAP